MSGRGACSWRRRLVATGIISLGASAAITLVVRVASLGSQGLMSARFGAGRELDSFFIALILPGLVVAPLASAIETAVAPSFARVVASKDLPRMAAFTTRIFAGSAVVGLALALAATAASPVLIRLFAPGAGDDRTRIASELALILYPSIFPRLVSAGAAGLSFGLGRLQAPLLIQVVNPVTIVVGLLLTGGRSPSVLAWAATAGWVLEAALLVAYLRRTAGAWSPGDPGPEYGVATSALRPLVVTYVVLQASPTIDQVFAASLGPGRLATFVIAARLLDSVLAMFVAPNARLAQNSLALASGGSAFGDLLRQQLKRAAFVGVVAWLALAVAAPVLTYAIYRHGEFTDADARATIAVAEVFAVALLPLSVGYLLPRALIAMGHNRTFLGLMVGQVFLNVGLDALLVGPLGGPGIALATVISYAAMDLAQWLVIRRVLHSTSNPSVVPQLEHEDGP